MATRFYKSIYKCFLSLEDYDIFGIPISVKLEGKEKHQSFMGFAATLSILIAIFFQLFSDLSFLFQYDISFQENIVQAPGSYVIDPQNFVLALGIQNNQNEFIFDEGLFQISAEYNTQQQILNSTTSYYEDVKQSNQIDLVQCTNLHFQHYNMTSYIGLQGMQKLFCLPLNEQIQLEGQQGANIFKWLTFKVKICDSSTSQNCQEIEEINKQLNGGRLLIYFMNYYLDLNNSKSAFKPNPQYLAYKTSSQAQKDINIQFRKTLIQTDNGIFIPNQMMEEQLIYSQDNYQIQHYIQNNNNYNSNTENIFQIDITLEKNKESLYSRSYTRLITHFSKLGGLFNFLYSIGILLCYPFSNMLFRQKLLNSIFSFQNKEQLEINGLFNNQQLIEQPTPTQKILANTPHASSIDFKISRKNTFNDSQGNSIKQANTFSQHCSGSTVNHYANNMQEDVSTQAQHLKLKIPSIDQVSFQQSTLKKRNSQKKVTIININDFKKNILSKRKTLFKSSDYINQKIISSFFNTTYNQFRVRFTDIFMSYFCKRRAKSQMISYGMQKLDYHLDINTIITKLLELEKLKRLLLDRDQIKLFEFIPKPIIHEEQFDRDTMTGITEHQSFAISNTGILYEDKRNVAQKAKDAEEAYHRITNQNKLSDLPINRKLLQLIDPRISSQFQQNIFTKNYESFTTSNFEINKELSKDSSKDQNSSPNQKLRSNFFSINFNDSIKD
ncbi:transmembrane protein, putative (macronuclear) [Tetrahymena thermophila SB210]|uniref:Transmembrane protein, putative n=1 Tax=Tetrahymena thermophila (strain SB210) TaxID=312017 RepID=Q22MP9_TETTS|nr:transmembrane protein, putative [Tetrahymena thermophila SB210]EAR86454.1 transmembrane protein, putative [Tetrahymena thermophila SB210]|eukprot:XP_976971.1 transmembrane protein, putative [Tetrahymena thermophila SB210]